MWLDSVVQRIFGRNRTANLSTQNLNLSIRQRSSRTTTPTIDEKKNKTFHTYVIEQ